MPPLSHCPIDILKDVFRWIPEHSIDACLLKQTSKWIKWILVSELEWKHVINPNLTFTHAIMTVLENLPPTSDAVLNNLQQISLVNGDMDVVNSLPRGTIELPFILAPIQYGHFECFKAVLAKHEQVGSPRVSICQYAFRAACLYGHLDIVNFLCYQAGVSIHHNQGEAIYLACGGGHLNVIQFLYARTAAKHFLKDTPIVSACKNGHLDILKFLVSVGARIKGRCGKRAISVAASGGYLEMVKYLHSINNQLHLSKVLRTACNNGHLNVVEYAYSKGADIHYRDDECIVLASTNGHLNVVRFLYSVGAIIHAQDDAAFMIAVQMGHLNVVEFLYSTGVDIHAHNYVHEAVIKGHLDVISLLHRLGANNPTMSTSIRQLCRLGRLEVLELLHSLGEDLFFDCIENVRAAQTGDHDHVVAFLNAIPWK